MDQQTYQKLIGHRLRQARMAKIPKLTQEKLAKLVGVTPSTVQRWERGEIEPGPYNRPLICQVLQIKEEELFGLPEKEAVMPPFPPSDVLSRGSLFREDTNGALCLELKITFSAGMQPPTIQAVSQEGVQSIVTASGANERVELSVPTEEGSNGQQQITVSAKVYQRPLVEDPSPIRQQAAGGGAIIPFIPPKRPRP